MKQTIYYELNSSFNGMIDFENFDYYFKEVPYHYRNDFLKVTPIRWTFMAKRIWVQDVDGTLRFLKNRHAPLNSPPDREEFIIIKLSANEI